MKKLKLWTCPKCNRQFVRQNQSHLCKIFLFENHFVGKAKGKLLYEKLIGRLTKQLGSFKVQSSACCIHLDKYSTFAAVKIFPSKILVECSLGYELTSSRIAKIVQLSANQYLHHININSAAEIDNELMEWLEEAYSNKDEKFLLRLKNSQSMKVETK